MGRKEQANMILYRGGSIGKKFTTDIRGIAVYDVIY